MNTLTTRGKKKVRYQRDVAHDRPIVEMRASSKGGHVVGVRYGANGVYYRQWPRTTKRAVLREYLDQAARVRLAVATEMVFNMVLNPRARRERLGRRS